MVVQAVDLVLLPSPIPPKSFGILKDTWAKCNLFYYFCVDCEHERLCFMTGVSFHAKVNKYPAQPLKSGKDDGELKSVLSN